MMFRDPLYSKNRTEVCIWTVSRRTIKKVGANIYYSTSCYVKDVPVHVGYNYCPYCGRKMRVYRE